MRIKGIHIRNFKRFTDLEIRSIPASAKLIMLAGPNGSGKSSLFDALSLWHRTHWKQNAFFWDEEYHYKKGAIQEPVRPNLGQEIPQKQQVEFHEEVSILSAEERKGGFYFRPAYRNTPEFQVQRLERMVDVKDEIRFNRMIDNDAAVQSNYQRIASSGVSDLFGGRRPKTIFEEYCEEVIGQIRDPLMKLFPDLELNDLGDPLLGGTFRFTKGGSEGFLYKNLSGGEKAAFDLILDMHVKKKEYTNAVFCIDEPEAHMNTRLQARLLEVLHDMVPDNCQLMLATHSIGMMRRAQDIEKTSPGKVVFLDFGGRDFDQAQVIEPTKPTKAFWRQVYQVALDDLADLVAPKHLVICEGHPATPDGSSNQEHDAQCYNQIFGEEFPDTRFVSVGNVRDVISDRFSLMAIMGDIVPGTRITRLIDLDDQSSQQVSEKAEQGIRVLSWRNLESYFFADEVLTALARQAEQGEKAEEILSKKQQLCNEKGARDDLKPVSGELYVACKNILGLTQCGNDTKAFMRDTLAPLIKPGMGVYDQLRRDIFGD